MDTLVFLLIGAAVGAATTAAVLGCGKKHFYSDHTVARFRRSQDGKEAKPKAVLLSFAEGQGKHTFVNELSEDVKIVFANGGPFRPEASGPPGEYVVSAGASIDLRVREEARPGKLQICRKWPYTASPVNDTKHFIDPAVIVRR